MLWKSEWVRKWLWKQTVNRMKTWSSPSITWMRVAYFYDFISSATPISRSVPNGTLPSLNPGILSKCALTRILSRVKQRFGPSNTTNSKTKSLGRAAMHASQSPRLKMSTKVLMMENRAEVTTLCKVGILGLGIGILRCPFSPFYGEYAPKNTSSDCALRNWVG